MIGELRVGFQTRTIIWNFFKKLNETFAECNYCHGHYNYGTTKSHLLKHVRRKHPDAILQFKKGKILPPVPRSDDISRTLSPGVGAHIEADGSQNGDKGADEESSSDVWSLFTRFDGAIAKCNLCEVELSCKYSITDLTKHWKTEHLGVLLKCDPSENEPTENGLCNITAEENFSSTPQISQVSSSNDEPAAKAPARNVQTKFRRSPGWNYFTKVDKTFAECKICHLHISHLSISNLMRHVVRKHPCQLLARARNGKRRNAEEDDDLALESQVSDVEAGSEEETSEEVDKIRKKASDTRVSDESLQLRRSKRMRTVKIESEDVSMNENLQSSQHQEDDITAEDKRIDPHSYVWQVFTKLKNYFYQCKICGATIFQRSNVGNLLRHIKRTHPTFVSAMQKKLAESVVAEGKCPSGRSTPVERDCPSSDEECAEPATAGGVVSDEPERNRVGQTESGGAKTSGRKRRGGAKSGKPKAEERGHLGAERGCLLSERFTSAVEEGNLLMRGLQERVERQGRALDRIAACLEGMQKNNS